MTPMVETKLQARPWLYLQLQRKHGPMPRLSPTHLMNTLRREEVKRVRYSFWANA